MKDTWQLILYNMNKQKLSKGKPLNSSRMIEVLLVNPKKGNDSE